LIQVTLVALCPVFVFFCTTFAVKALAPHTVVAIRTALAAYLLGIRLFAVRTHCTGSINTRRSMRTLITLDLEDIWRPARGAHGTSTFLTGVACSARLAPVLSQIWFFAISTNFAEATISCAVLIAAATIAAICK
jgi:hypothetical protein